MKGSYEIIIQNVRLQYKLKINRNITIIKGDSATGKTTLIDMVASYQLNGVNSGIEISSPKPCIVLNPINWEMILLNTKNSIVFIDEGCEFVSSSNFARIAKQSDNYYVIATRSGLYNLPYSVNEVYGIKNKTRKKLNKYQGTTRLYSEFYPIHKEHTIYADIKEVLVEDSNSGFEFFSEYFNKYDIPCFSTNGKSNICEKISNSNSNSILIIADGAAIGSEIEKILKLRSVKNIAVYLPESFEWLILKSNLLNNGEIRKILNNPSEYIECREYFSWERFFHNLLIKHSKNTYLKYSKSKLNEVYLQDKEMTKIMENSPIINT